MPSSATGVQADAVGGYIINNSATLGGGVGGGSVALYGVSICNVTGGACWGGNTVVSDVAGKASPKLIGFEIDTNVYNATTIGEGLIFNGNFQAQPTNFPAINVVKPFNAGGFTYSDGIRVNDGATANGLALNIGATGASTSFCPTCGNSVNSAAVMFAGHDSGGGVHLVSLSGIQGGDGGLNVSRGTPPSLTTTATLQVFPGVPSGACPNTTLGINVAGTASTILYVCPTGTSTWTAITVP